MLGHPPERNSFQITEKQRRVTDGCEATAHVRHDENEKHDVMRRDAVFVHPNPRTDEQHRSARGAQQVGDDGADEQKDHVRHRCGFAFDVDVNAARDDEQRADERDEAYIFVPHVQHTLVSVQAEEIVAKRNGAEPKRYFGIMFRPPVGKEKRCQRNRRQQRHKR